MKTKLKNGALEKDPAFNSRCQGYGLTMQQGGRILQKMGIENFQQYLLQSQTIGG